MGIKKAYVAHDLSRKKFKDRVFRKREREKAKHWCGCYLSNACMDADDPLYNREYVRYFYKGRYAKFYKNYNNRRIRRAKVYTTIPQHSGYRKFNEYWWIID